MVGGTAIALHLGHRRSIDFDLFTHKTFQNEILQKKITSFHKISRVMADEKDQYSVIIQGVRLTFLRYPFKIRFTCPLDHVIKLPSLCTLAAMKAYALGRRAKWKDYVDLYFIMKDHHSLQDIVKEAKKIFHHEFNEKLLRTQLAYFKDIDYTEKIHYFARSRIHDKTIQKALIEFSVE